MRVEILFRFSFTLKGICLFGTPMRMTGCSRPRFGQSKFELKRQARRDGFGRRWWAYFDKKIFSPATRKKYLAVNERFVRFCGERFQIEPTAFWLLPETVAMFNEYVGLLQELAARAGRSES